MSSAADPTVSKPVKMMITGDSGVGKTGLLLSLICAGYKVRVIDVDNGVDIILHGLKSPDSPYYSIAKNLDLSEAFRYETVNHKMITIDDGKRVRIQPGAATVWPAIEKLSHEWRETSGKNLGSITTWKDDTILVLDSLTFAGIAAMYYIQQLNNRLGSESAGNSWRRDSGLGQDELRKILQLFYSDAVKCHVIVISHIDYLSESYQTTDTGRTRVVSNSASAIFGSDRAYPSSIGRALGPQIGRYFNNVLEMRQDGQANNVRRIIHTTPQGAINVKTSAPFSLKPTYGVSTGLAEIFAVLRNQPPPTELIEALGRPSAVRTVAASAAKRTIVQTSLNSEPISPVPAPNVGAQ